MRINVLLAFCSTLLCLTAGYAALTLIALRNSVPAGAAFESIDDLRTQIAARDGRDLKPDKSVSFRSIIEPDSSNYIIYRLKPNLDVRFQRVRVRTNSHGMRGPERQVEKEPRIFRIALLGDSYAFGWGVEEEESFAFVIEQELGSRVGPDKSIEVLNFGVPGYSTSQQVTHFFEYGLRFSPDLVVVFFVDNDFSPPFIIKTDEEFIGSLDPNQHLAKLADAMGEKNVPVFVTMNPRRNSAADEQRLPILKTHPNLRYVPIKERYLKLIRERGLSPGDLTLKRDVHPNALRHQIYGELIAADLLSVLRKHE